MSSRHNRFNTHGNWRVCTKSTQVPTRKNPGTMKRRWTESSTPYQEAVCNWYLVRKGQSVSCNRAATGHINSALGQTSHPLAGQHKTDSVVVCVQAGAWAHVSKVLCLTDHFLVWLFLFPLAIFLLLLLLFLMFWSVLWGRKNMELVSWERTWPKHIVQKRF